MNKNLIYDIGMHKGEDSDFYLKKGYRVIAFEADPDLIELSKSRFVNQIKNKQLVIVEGAIVDYEKYSKETVEFYKNDEESVWGTISKKWANRNDRLGKSSTVISVKAINFNEILNQFGIPYYMKIDIEGLDTICLKALLNFAQKPKYISIETSKDFFKNFDYELELLSEIGYKNFKAIQQKDVPFQIQPNPSKEGTYAEHNFLIGSSGLFGSDLAGSWYSKRQISFIYRLIFINYYLFGDQGIIRGNFIFELCHQIICKLFNKSIPGWHDIHAK
tara:strand:- start:403 stop:1227 length:825 start_codon:yes stop_codon:yes gene_type:complete